MKLIFEKSVPGRGCGLLPACDVEAVSLPAGLEREVPPALPEMSETDVSRHYTELCQHVHGVNCGFYPLGSCTMKYNPRIDEEMAALPGFTAVHPLAPADATIGCREVLDTAKRYLCEITGMDDMTFQPAAGAHGEFTGVLLIKQYHDARGDSKRRKIIVPDSAHGTNPATAAMCGYEVVNIASAPNGCVDLEALKAVLGDDTAGLMLTNPNTVGIFDDNILEITRLVHEAGGLCYYDGANLNAVMGVVRPGDMGFDCIHMNLHKTFATPHGGGGPGRGARGGPAPRGPGRPPPLPPPHPPHPLPPPPRRRRPGMRRPGLQGPPGPLPAQVRPLRRRRRHPGPRLLRQLPGGGQSSDLRDDPGPGGRARGGAERGAQRQLPDG